METYKAVIDYSRRSNPQLGVLAQAVHDAMTESAATFSEPPVSMPLFQTQITGFNAKMIARLSNASADVVAMQIARQEMLTTLRRQAGYVNTVAAGSQAIIVLSAFPYYDTRRAPLPVPPPAPVNLRLRHGGGTGIIVLRFTPALSPAASEVQVNLGDPVNEAQWLERGTYYNGRVTLDGFAPGVMVWVRVRTVGRGNTLSDWSDSVQIRTL